MPRESKLAKQKRCQNCLMRLREAYGEVVCGLNFDNDPWRLLVMGILAAQCTDKRVNMVSPKLFAAFPNVLAFAEAKVADIKPYIASCGLYQRKAEQIQQAACALIERFDGVVPADLEALVSLPGVGRKIANLVISDYFHLPGMVVDTHNQRLSQRLGFTKQKTAAKIEADLCQLLPPEEWASYGHYMVEHGRAICQARRPDCLNCCLADLCPSFCKG